ncbi:hypothetical protein GCM10010211_27580 [Streptomyces albospinus]|uniref:Uncharacterized protein n=1 Tax=Streptomyces albospinus TaxID=285515 RepID=A0ABQ2V0D5_9ACTN|nr:hypothetical protein [Streptomyces albospinus]GGU61148.1 hypothetical protein GCM10010211_27580 [Streptomyces albospinus]
MTITGDVTVVVHDEDADAQELDELTQQLHAELLRLELPDVARGSAPGGTGAKSGLVQSLTTLVLSGGFSAAVLRSVTVVVRDWIRRSGARKAVLVSGEHRLEIEAASKKTQDAAVEAWVRALAGEPAPATGIETGTDPAADGAPRQAAPSPEGPAGPAAHG